MKIKHSLFLLVLLSGIGKLAHAQPRYFPYYTADSMVFVRFADSCSKNVNRSFVLPAGVNSKYKKDYVSMKEEATDHVRSLVRYTAITDSLLHPYLQSVLKNIADANPSLKKYSIVLSDWPVMNAAYVGGNVIIFFAPLLSRLNNESEVASILCHELAHGELDHVQKKIKKTLDEFYSEAFQKELKKTMKEEFNLDSKINLLAMKFTFGSRYHDRTFEKAADSLGYVFLSKTKYNSREFTSALAVLKEVDEPVFKDSIDYPRFFRCANSQFDFGSIRPYKATSLFNKTTDAALPDSLADSLKTHPDCDKRIAYIEELMKSVPAHGKAGDDTTRFLPVKWAAAMEMIMAFYSYEYYDLSLFNALQYLQHYPDNEFLRAMVVLNWYGLFKAMKDHELSDYISNYSEETPAQLNNLIFMINNMRIPQMVEFANCFASSNAVGQKEYSLACNYCTAKFTDDKSCTTFQDQYKSLYTRGRFTNLMELNPKPAGKKSKKKKN